MNTNEINFISFEPQSFAGISSTISKDMVIVFPANKHIVEFTGNQGVCKTSNIECLKLLLGGDEVSNALNKVDDTKKAELTLEIDGEKHLIKVSKSSFSVELLKETTAGKVTPYKVSSPKNFIRDKIGGIGISPMGLKEMKGKEQIEWMRKIFRLSDEQISNEKKIQADYQKAYDDRTDVNRDLAKAKKALLETQYYQWEDENKVFHPADALSEAKEVLSRHDLNDTAINAQYQAAYDKHQEYIKCTGALTGLKEKKTTAESDIAELERRLAEKKQELAALEKRITDGEAYLAANNTTEQALKEAQELLKNSGDLKLMAQRVHDAEKQYASYNELEERKIELEGQLERCIALQKDIVKESTPDIEGLEIIVANWDPTKAEGLYYKDRTMSELSESELWDLYLQLCRSQNIRIMFIENITSLGTGAIDRINWFANNGGRVFVTKMDRSLDNLKVNFYDQLD